MTYHKGYISLLNVLIISVVGTLVVMGVLLYIVDQNRLLTQVSTDLTARLLEKECREEALQHLVEAFSYAGSDTIVTSEGSCSYIVSAGATFPKTISVTSTVASEVIETLTTLSEEGVFTEEL